MTLLLQIVLSNVVISLSLAVLAWIVGTMTKRPKLSYLLWLLVLVKLVTPPVYSLPIFSIPSQSELSVLSIQPGPESVASVLGIEGIARTAASWLSALNSVNSGLLLIWLLGSLMVLSVSAVRIYRFGRLLKEETEEATEELQTKAEQLAARLKLKKVPAIYTTAALISPLVWWTGGKVRIVLPAKLIARMDSNRFDWILAHELTHVHRKDYLVRWIEWAVIVCFWWNPVVYWARHNLRIQEEHCCDALVIARFEGSRRSYADSLLKAIELMARPAYRAPAFASELNSGGFLKQRFKAIISGKPLSAQISWLQASILACLIAALPFGIGYEITRLAFFTPAYAAAADTDQKNTATENSVGNLDVSSEIVSAQDVDGEGSSYLDQAELAAAGEMAEATSPTLFDSDDPNAEAVTQNGYEEFSYADEQAEIGPELSQRIAIGSPESPLTYSDRDNSDDNTSRPNDNGVSNRTDPNRFERPDYPGRENGRTDPNRLERPENPGNENGRTDPNRLERPENPGNRNGSFDPDRLELPERRGGHGEDNPRGGDDSPGGRDGDHPGGGDGDHPGGGGGHSGHHGGESEDRYESHSFDHSGGRDEGDRIGDFDIRYPEQEAQYNDIDGYQTPEDQRYDKYGYDLLEDERYDMRDRYDFREDDRYDGRDYQEYEFFDQMDDRDFRNDSRHSRSGKGSKR